MPTTPRLSLPYPTPDDTTDVPRDVQALAQAVDSGAAMYAQGTIAARPVSTPASPGKAGRFYWATDRSLLYVDTGTAWSVVSGANAARTAYGRWIPTTGMGANRKTYTFPHGQGATPLAWQCQSGPILGSSTSNGQIENVTVSKFSEDATNLVVLCVLTNGATAAVGPPYLDWWGLWPAP